MRTCSILLSVDVSVHSYCVSLAPLPPSCFFYPAHVPPCRHPPPSPTYCQPIDQQTVHHQPRTANHQLKPFFLQPLGQLAFIITFLASAAPALQSGFCFHRASFVSKKASSRLPSPLPRVVVRGILPFHNSSALVDDNRSCTLMPRATPSQPSEHHVICKKIGPSRPMGRREDGLRGQNCTLG